MKNILLFIPMLLCTFVLTAQSPVGGWIGETKSPDGQDLKMVVIFTDKYQSATWYDAHTGEFIMTNGGTWSLDGNQMTEIVEYDSNNPKRVGNTLTFEIELTEKTLKISGEQMELHRLDYGNETPLAGAWLISGRKNGDEIRKRDTSGPRKTMKILSGTIFQWTAYNTETGEFLGTGGGTYTAVDNIYTESISFFSRDNNRVGANLNFNFEVIDGDWHHSGNSSKGDPIYEIWSLR